MLSLTVMEWDDLKTKEDFRDYVAKYYHRLMKHKGYDLRRMALVQEKQPFYINADFFQIPG